MVRFLCSDGCALQHLFHIDPVDARWLLGYVQFVVPDIVFEEMHGRGVRKNKSSGPFNDVGAKALALFSAYEMLDLTKLIKTDGMLLSIARCQKQYKLDAGEAACLLICEERPYLHLLTDDDAGYLAAQSVLGDNRTFSSFDLVLWSVVGGKLELDNLDRGIIRLNQNGYGLAKDWRAKIEGMLSSIPKPARG